MLKTITLIVSLLMINFSFATSIVVIVTKNSVLLAADSKVSHNFSRRDSSSSIVCKIYKCNDFYFAIDGFVYQEPWYKLDTIVWNAVQNAQSFEDAITKIKFRWKKVLDETYMNLASNYRKFLLKNYDWINHSTVYLIGTKNNIPHFEGIKAICEGTTPSDVKIKFMSLSVSSSDIATDSAVVCESSIGVLERSEFNLPKAIKQPKKEAIRIIERRILGNPSSVSKPIDAIWITKEKIKWIGKKRRPPVKL